MLRAFYIPFLLVWNLAWAAPLPNMDATDPANAELYQSGYVFRRDTRTFSILKNYVPVLIPANANVYAFPDYAAKPDILPRDKASDFKCNLRGPGGKSGQVVWSNKTVSAVYVDQTLNCGPDFNKGDGNPNVVFVRTDLLTPYSTEIFDSIETDAMTEAALPACSGPDCRQKAIEDLQTKLMLLNMGMKCEDVSDFKNQQALEGYLACYSTPNQDDYIRYYGPLMDIAASKLAITYDPGAEQVRTPTSELMAFTDEKDDPMAGRRLDAPLIVSPSGSALRCLARRESEWNRNAKSPTGAKGIGQQTQGNITDINENLKNDPALRAVWMDYFRAARAAHNDADWKKLTTNTSDPSNPKPCPSTELQWAQPIKPEDAYCPITSIGTMAMYQMMVEFAIRRDNAEYRETSFTSDQSTEFILLLSLAHNAGITAVRKAAVGDPKYWVGNLLGQKRSDERKEEIANYRKYIKRCLSGDPDEGWMPPDNSKRRDCRPHIPPKDCK